MLLCWCRVCGLGCGSTGLGIAKWFCCYIIHTHTRLTALFSGTTRVSQYQKRKTNLNFTEARDCVSGSGITWAICKSAPRSRQIPRQHPTAQFYTGRMPFLLPNQRRQSTEGTPCFRHCFLVEKYVCDGWRASVLCRECRRRTRSAVTTLWSPRQPSCGIISSTCDLGPGLAGLRRRIPVKSLSGFTGHCQLHCILILLSVRCNPDITYGLFRRQLKTHLFREAWTRRSVTTDIWCNSKTLTYLLTYLHYPSTWLIE